MHVLPDSSGSGLTTQKKDNIRQALSPEVIHSVLWHLFGECRGCTEASLPKNNWIRMLALITEASETETQ